jgi:hypothetical protein
VLLASRNVFEDVERMLSLKELWDTQVSARPPRPATHVPTLRFVKVTYRENTGTYFASVIVWRNTVKTLPEDFHFSRYELRAGLASSFGRAALTVMIIDVRVTNTDAKSQRHKDPAKVHVQHKQEKQWKCLEPCLKQRRHFAAFVVFTDGMLRREATILGHPCRLMAPAILSGLWLCQISFEYCHCYIHVPLSSVCMDK